MNKFTAAASVALALVAGSAFAADLPSRKEAPVYVPPPPSFSWNGLYGGMNIGYGFGAGGQEWGGLGYITPGVVGRQPGIAAPAGGVPGRIRVGRHVQSERRPGRRPGWLQLAVLAVASFRRRGGHSGLGRA